MTSGPHHAARLFYSYSHRDAEHQDSIETALALLRNEGLLSDWSDRSILPGQSISASVRSKLDEADVICFLLSQHFIASEECMREWRHAKARSDKGSNVVRVPIVLSDCAWKDLLRDDDLKALPRDGKPVVSYPDKLAAWQQVYDGLKSIIEVQRRTFSSRPEFLHAMEATDLVSQDHISLSDIFVFPSIVQFQSDPDQTLLFENKIENFRQLLSHKHCIVHGEEMSGKSSLARQTVLTLAKQREPVMFVDLLEEQSALGERYFRLYTSLSLQATLTSGFDNLERRSFSTI